jgi:alpha-acetolactate decarboxylase
MAFTITPLAGVDLANLAQTNPNSAGTAVATFGPLGAEVFGSDGFRYVFAQAGAAIGVSTATCTINASTFQATPSAGTYLSGASMASGDYGWFSKASV